MSTKTRTARYAQLGLDKDLEILRMLAVSGSVLLIALAVLEIRYGHVHFPYAKDERRQSSTSQPGYDKE